VLHSALLLALFTVTPWEVPPAAIQGLKNPVPAKLLAASLERGRALYAKECAGCHGAEGRGDGPDGLYFSTKPSDLTTAEVKKQSDAVLFFKLAQGRGDMKAYEKVYDAPTRWDLINAVRALAVK
jgi:mono/diheme cytochrome c family protein